MKYLKFVPYLLFVVVIATLIAGMGTKVTKTEEIMSMRFTLRVKYLGQDHVNLAYEMVDVVKHQTFVTQKLTGDVVDQGCWLSFVGQDYGSADMNDVRLNYNARNITDKANAILASYGGPFKFEYDIGSVWNTDCDETERFIDVEVWFTNSQLNGGFLTYTEYDGNETAWIHVPSTFYDFILQSVVKGEEFDFTKFIYPSISEVGGYRILPDDPSGLASWMLGQQPFLEKVYSHSIQVTAVPGVYDYTTTTQERYISSYGCQNYNYKGVCTDRGPNYQNYTQEHDNQIEVVIGSMILK